MTKRLGKWAWELLLLAAFSAVAWGICSYALGKYYRDAYPIKYQSLIDAACEKRGLDRALVYAVVRTESGFRPDVTSSVGARGLMQLMPDAFDWVRMRQNKEPVAEKALLFDPEVNIDSGTAMLRLLLDEFGSIENALCAYHAGRGSVNSWLQNPAYAPDGEQVTNIPFADTRAYVAKVCKTREMYQKIYGI